MSDTRHAGRFLGTAILALAAAVLAGCAALPAPGPGAASTLLVGQIKLDAHGVGRANNGADGLINSYYPSGAVMTIADESGGTRYETVTLTPANLFTLPGVEPGRYKILELRCQVQTMNAWVTLDTKFSASPEFDVTEGKVNNLGVLLWRVDFDLWTRDARAAFSPVEGGAALVTTAFARWFAGSPWIAAAGVPVSPEGESRTASTATALQPRAGHGPFLLLLTM